MHASGACEQASCICMQASDTDKDAKDGQSRADKQHEAVPAPEVQSVPRPQV